MAEEMSNNEEIVATRLPDLEPEDVQDARGGKSWTDTILEEIPPPYKHNEAKMPVGRDDDEYNMNHRSRGKAVIFNHKEFTIPGLSIRNGTDVDRDNLAKTLQQLDFEVEIYNDLTGKQLQQKLNSLADEDHSDRDCFLMAVFSHGIPNKIYAKDYEYSSNMLWDAFTAEQCPSLAGKPKIFLIQACQGDQVDSGVKLKFANMARTETDSLPKHDSYRIPNRADFVTVFSTFPGYYSWRNTSQGSWFIQSVCNVFRKYGHHKELLALLTIVARQVALNYESNVPGNYDMDQKKQIPFMTSTLMREVYFCPKTSTGESQGQITVMKEKKIPYTFKSLVRPPSLKDSPNPPAPAAEGKTENASGGTSKLVLVNPE